VRLGGGVASQPVGQVIKPVNLEAMSKWVGQIPGDVVRDMADIAPMLSVLGYDPYANPPDYGKPDAWVQDNTSKVRCNPAGSRMQNKLKTPRISHFPCYHFTISQPSTSVMPTHTFISNLIVFQTNQ